MSDSKNQYINTARTVEIGNPSWQLAQDSGLTDLSVRHIAHSRMIDQNEHAFMNMCSCSYLGLEIDQRLAQRAAQYVLQSGTVNLPTSRIRIRLKELDELEQAMSAQFRCSAFTATSCSAGIVASLPLLAAGMFTDGQRPYLIFDKYAHFALNQVKAICGDETQVVTCNHNDVEFIEDMCKRHPLVAYVADGAYSMGGSAPIERLLELQEKYGLFLYFDDSHSLSAYGERGEGYIRTFMPELSPRTMLVYSLAKAFGANGGGIFMSQRANYQQIFDLEIGTSILQYGQRLAARKLLVNTLGNIAVRSQCQYWQREVIYTKRLTLFGNVRQLFVIRSFSKYFGLAGLRLGYVVTRPESVRELMKVRGPWDVNHVAVKAAMYCLQNQATLRLAHEKLDRIIK